MNFLHNSLARKRRGEKGFSFLELIIVVAVIGILTAIAIPSYGAIQSNAKQAAVDSNAQNGYRLVMATMAGFDVVSASNVTTARLASTNTKTAKTPQQALDSLKNEDIDLAFLDKNGAVIENPSDDFCVYAFNQKEGATADGKPRYFSLVGDCPIVPPNYPGATTPETPGEPTPDPTDPPIDPTPEPTDPPVEPEPTPEPTEPEEPVYAGDETASNAIYELRCTVTTNWSHNLKGFTGTQKWSDGTELPATGVKQLMANVTYRVEFDGKYTVADDIRSKNPLCLRKVESWGSSSSMYSLQYALAKANNIEYVAPIPSGVNDIEGLFSGNTKFNQDINDWDMSDVTDMNQMFAGATAFNQPLDKWDVSKVTNFQSMFNGASSFNQDISGWDTSSATNMLAMLNGTTRFTYDVSGWNVNNAPKPASFANTSGITNDKSKWPAKFR